MPPTSMRWADAAIQPTSASPTNTGRQISTSWGWLPPPLCGSLATNTSPGASVPPWRASVCRRRCGRRPTCTRPSRRPRAARPRDRGGCTSSPCPRRRSGSPRSARSRPRPRRPLTGAGCACTSSRIGSTLGASSRCSLRSVAGRESRTSAPRASTRARVARAAPTPWCRRLSTSAGPTSTSPAMEFVAVVHRDAGRAGVAVELHRPGARRAPPPAPRPRRQPALDGPRRVTPLLGRAADRAQRHQLDRHAHRDRALAEAARVLGLEARLQAVELRATAAGVSVERAPSAPSPGGRSAGRPRAGPGMLPRPRRRPRGRRALPRAAWRGSTARAAGSTGSLVASDCTRSRCSAAVAAPYAENTDARSGSTERRAPMSCGDVAREQAPAAAVGHERQLRRHEPAASRCGCAPRAPSTRARPRGSPTRSRPGRGPTRSPTTAHATRARVDVERHATAEEALGVDVAEHDERVGERGLRPAPAVARGTRVGARRPRADPDRTHRVHPRERAAAGADGVDVDHRQRSPVPEQRPAGPAQRLAARDERDVERRAAEVAGDHVGIVQLGRELGGRGRTRRGAGLREADRNRPRARRPWSRRRSSA